MAVNFRCFHLNRTNDTTTDFGETVVGDNDDLMMVFGKSKLVQPLVYKYFLCFEFSYPMNTNNLQVWAAYKDTASQTAYPEKANAHPPAKASLAAGGSRGPDVQTDTPFTRLVRTFEVPKLATQPSRIWNGGCVFLLFVLELDHKFYVTKSRATN